MNNPATYPTPQSVTIIEADVALGNRIDDTDGWDTKGECSDLDGAKRSDQSETDSLADEEYWEENRAADAWLARNPGGSRHQYPQLFVVEARQGKVLTPAYNSNRTCFLSDLPPEIRGQIYRHCFDADEEIRYPEEEYAPLQDLDDRQIPKICLSSENVELKFWLSAPLLQTSRQLRSEAVSILFENRVITVEWLPLLPRFVEFLGRKGCAMVRYLDIWDILNLQGHQKDEYRDIIKSVSQFSHLRHLRIVLTGGILINRTRSWFHASDWTLSGKLKKSAVPIMRFEDIQSYWPEYEVLKTFKAKKFTLAVDSASSSNRYYCDFDGIIEFDRDHGAYSGIIKSMQSYSVPKDPALWPALVSASSNSPEILEAFDVTETQPQIRGFTPSSESNDEPSDTPTWQVTDSLNSKSIPLYNYVREFFHNNLYPWLGEICQKEMPVQNFCTFPTARKSTGSIMRDCAFCYLSERHCGYHAVPDQAPFEPERLEDDGVAENVQTPKTQFEDLSYVEMRETCRCMLQLLDDTHEDVASDLFRALTVFEYLGWPKMRIGELLERLDAAVEAGWTGKRIDKEEVPPWDMLYRELSVAFRSPSCLWS
ncbi:hypothetical protein MMC13_000173 [Lambiella insularis]|nr:hypothetical protein [Lambiella insularis]